MSSNMNHVASSRDAERPNDAPDRATRPEKAQASTFRAALDAALYENDIRAARCIVAEEEARQIESVGAAQTSITAEISAAKARIAMATNDGPAAQAILLAAIEAAPENRSLRVLMSEMMLANGRASDVRPVLKHVGKQSAACPQDRSQVAGDGM